MAQLPIVRRTEKLRDIAVIDLLNEMKLPEDPWTESALTLTRRHAAFYPNFMKPAANKPVFTDREYQVYSLMIAGYKTRKLPPS